MGATSWTWTTYSSGKTTSATVGVGTAHHSCATVLSGIRVAQSSITPYKLNGYKEEENTVHTWKTKCQ